MSTMPSSPEIEADVLGSALAEGMTWWNRVALGSEVEDPLDLFYDEDHLIVARAFEKVRTSGMALTQTTALDALLKDPSSERLAPKQRDFLSALVTQATCSTLDDLALSISALEKSAWNRQTINNLEKLTNIIRTTDPEPNQVVGEIRSLASINSVGNEIRRFGEVLAELDAQQAGEPKFRLRTNLTELDESFNGGVGLSSGRSLLIAARPGVGKTTQMINMALHALSDGCVVILASLEMQEQELHSKFISAQAMVNLNKVTKWVEHGGSHEELFTPEEWERVQEADQGLRECDLFTIFASDIPNGIDSIISSTLKVIQSNPNVPIVLIVDYLQLLTTGNNDVHKSLDVAARKIKLLANQEDIIAISASQLNRAGAESMPTLHQLRGSGTLEEHADIVLLLDRPNMRDEAEPEDLMVIHVAKNRIGKRKYINASWQPEIQSIGDLDFNKSSDSVSYEPTSRDSADTLNESRGTRSRRSRISEEDED